LPHSALVFLRSSQRKNTTVATNTDAVGVLGKPLCTAELIGKHYKNYDDDVEKSDALCWLAPTPNARAKTY